VVSVVIAAVELGSGLTKARWISRASVLLIVGVEGEELVSILSTDSSVARSLFDGSSAVRSFSGGESSTWTGCGISAGGLDCRFHKNMRVTIAAGNRDHLPLAPKPKIMNLRSDN
jgi:hypothetical protein